MSLKPAENRQLTAVYRPVNWAAGRLTERWTVVNLLDTAVFRLKTSRTQERILRSVTYERPAGRQIFLPISSHFAYFSSLLISSHATLVFLSRHVSRKKDSKMLQVFSFVLLFLFSSTNIPLEKISVPPYFSYIVTIKTNFFKTNYIF